MPRTMLKINSPTTATNVNTNKLPVTNSDTFASKPPLVVAVTKILEKQRNPAIVGII